MVTPLDGLAVVMVRILVVPQLVVQEGGGVVVGVSVGAGAAAGVGVNIGTGDDGAVEDAVTVIALDRATSVYPLFKR